MLVLASNDYCDLARDPRVVRAAADAAARWGAGSGGARLTTGSQPPHAARENAAFLVRELAERGVAATTRSAIVPIPVGDETAAVRASERLLAEGVWIPAIRYPTVARGAARLRASVMSAHTRKDLAFAAAAIARALPRP